MCRTKQHTPAELDTANTPQGKNSTGQRWTQYTVALMAPRASSQQAQAPDSQGAPVSPQPQSSTQRQLLYHEAQRHSKSMNLDDRRDAPKLLTRTFLIVVFHKFQLNSKTKLEDLKNISSGSLSFAPKHDRLFLSKGSPTSVNNSNLKTALGKLRLFHPVDFRS